MADTSRALRPHQHRFWHTASDVVHFQLLIQRIEEGVGDWFEGVCLLRNTASIFIAVGKQELGEGHWGNLHEVDLAYWKRGSFRQSDAQQRTGAGNMVLRCVLAEIFHGVNNLGAVLHLIKDNKGLFRQDFLTAGKHQIL